MPTSSYSGKDVLDLMESAHNYNRWIEQWLLSSLIGTKVVDFGAGTGLFAERLTQKGLRVTCIESDEVLRDQLKKKNFTADSNLEHLHVQFDSVYSINVLEHIADDTSAARLMVQALKPGGRLVIYVPAFSLLYSSLDQKIGHQRRYTQKTLCSLFPDFKILDCRYVDPMGFFASLYLKHCGSTKKPLSRKMVEFYDRWVFPMSASLTPLTHRFFGKNVYLVAEKK